MMMALLFYFFPGRSWLQRLLLTAGVVYVNAFLMGSQRVSVLGFEISQQSAAILALIPIFLHSGRQGKQTKAMQLFHYAFYPAHMLLLGLLAA